MSAILSPGAVGALGAFLSVVIIDVVLAGDNAIVVGMAAAHLEKRQRRRAIFWGIVAATVMRIVLALIAVDLLTIVGLTLAGGFLLLWVAWKLYRDLTRKSNKPTHDAKPAPYSFRQALLRIVLADVSMSLDNVLAVAGYRARSRLGTGGGAHLVGRADGRCLGGHRAADRALSLDRLDRPRDRHPGRVADDL